MPAPVRYLVRRPSPFDPSVSQYLLEYDNGVRVWVTDRNAATRFIAVRDARERCVPTDDFEMSVSPEVVEA